MPAEGTVMNKNRVLFERALGLLPGGVSSPVRSFSAVTETPPFIVRGEGSKLYDENGNEYIDYVLSWGPLILGHADPEVVEAVCARAKQGLSFGAPTEVELLLAEEIRNLIPSIEKIRFVNSGTEAVMSAIRVARGFTKRKKIVKFSGCYHGHADYLLVSAGSGGATFNSPDSLGVTESNMEDTLIARYNDFASVETLFKKFGEEIAALILEPVAGNMGVVLPVNGFLEGIRALCTKYGSLLIFDEVMTGFRAAFPSVQTLYGARPDLTILGKVIGGGMPVGAFGGKREVMDVLAPSGGVYQAGTLSGNPVAMVSGITTLRKLQKSNLFDCACGKARSLVDGIRSNLDSLGLEYRVNSMGTMFSIFFTEQEVSDFDSAKTSDLNRFARYFSSMLKCGVYCAPSQFEACFLSSAHTADDIEKTIDSNLVSLKEAM
jgi:glutamate-1-semialdehyde 2,1-aminomutase